MSILKQRDRSSIQQLLHWLPWVVPTAALVTMVLIVFPRRGIHLAGDEGLFLVSALGAARGQGADLIIPQSAHYVVNAILIKLGATDLWFFKSAFLTGVAISTASLICALSNGRSRSALAPIAAAPALLINLNQTYNHYTVSIALLSIGVALIVWGQREYRPPSNQLTAAGSALLGIATVFNAAIGAAIVVAVALLHSTHASRSLRYVGVTVFATTATAWIVYLAYLGPTNILATPSHNALSVFQKGWGVGSFFLHVLASLAVSIACLQLIIRDWRIAIFTATALMTSASLTWMIAVQAQLILGFAACYPKSSHILYLFMIDFCHDTRLGVFAYWALFSSVAGMYFYEKHRLVSIGHIMTRIRSVIRLRSGVGTLLALSRPSFKARGGALTLTGALFCLVVAAGAVGSNSHFGVGMSWSAGLAIGLSGLIGNAMAKQVWEHHWTRVNVVLGLVGSAIFALNFNHSSGKTIFSGTDVYLTEGRLRGNYFKPAEIAFLDRFMTAFEGNECQKSTFVILDYMPLMYFATDKLPPDQRLRAIRPAYYYPSALISATLSQAEHWCVLELTTQETGSWIRSRADDPTATVRELLEKHTRTTVLLPSPGSDIVGLPKLLIGDGSVGLRR